jgi:hypothetical protein
MAGLRNPRDYGLVNLSLLTPVGVIDLRYIMVELCYQEDIFSNAVHGYVMITESNAYAEILNLTGNETLRVTFSKTNTDIEIDKTFRVYKLDNRKLSGNMYTESYVLYFCSEEMLLSEQYKISKSYPNQDIATNITDICTTYLGIPSEKLFIDPTYGTYSFIVPNLKPFDAINWFSTYARPAEDVPGADMLFFENKNGFNFKSLQYISGGPDSVFYGTYKYEPKNQNDKDLQDETLDVTTYEIMSSYDSLGAINSGIFANQLISVDILTRNKITTNFDYFDYWNNQPSLGLNKYPITNNYINRFGQQLNETNQSVLKLVFSNFDDANNAVVQSNPGSVAQNIFAETYIPYRTAQLSLANYTRVKLNVPGDPNLTVGIVIEFELLSNNPDQHEKGTNNFYSGYYLVTAVKHLITQNDYKTVMEVAKESVPTEYLGINTSSTLNKSVSGETSV